MKATFLMIASAAAALTASAYSHSVLALTYPATAKDDVVDIYHGTKVADPYRWLEDDNSSATKAWVEAQNKVTFAYLEQLPEREKIKQRLTELWNYERYGLPFKEGGRFFWTRNDGLQAQDVLYSATTLEGAAAVLLDPNTFSQDGTVALASYSVSRDGKYIAYAVSSGGSDWNEWRVHDIATGKDLSDVLQWSKFSQAAWTKDSKGFFYNRYEEPKAGDALKGVNVFPKLVYHRLGTPQAEDRLVYERVEDKELGFDAQVTDDGKYLLISVWRGTDRRNDIAWMPLGEGGNYVQSKITPLIEGFLAQHALVGSIDRSIYLRTDDSAPRGRIIAVNLDKPGRRAWKVIVEQSKDTIGALSMEDAHLVNRQIIVNYLKDARNEVRIFALNGKLLREVKLPGLGSAHGFSGRNADSETFYAYSSFTSPASTYRLDLKNGDVSVVKRPKVAFDPEAFESHQVFFKSKDGTRIPMFIVHKKGIKLDGDNPLWLYGYGGFNIALTPTFSASRIPWLEKGGVFVQVNLRGGGEYGKAWHEAGIKQHKQNVFDDFIGAAEWLIANQYTSAKKIAINGGSNGGLLVGAVLNQRPELFAAAVPEVGVMDMLRFHKFTIGWAWISDYGSAEQADEFKTLMSYSPLHNIKHGVKYPPTLILTADHDDRVVPALSFKYAAAMQAANPDNAGPLLIRIGTRAGHGAGKSVQKIIEERSDVTAFLLHALQVAPHASAN